MGNRAMVDGHSPTDPTVGPLHPSPETANAGETATEVSSPTGQRFNASVQAPTYESFGRYIVLKELGRGGMGAVYEAYDPELGRRVALKITTVRSREPSNLEQEERVQAFRTRFIREARSLAKLKHPHIVGVFDVGTLPSGEVYLAMELLEGEALARRIARQPMDWREALPIFLNAIDALAHAHQAGLIHRDLKPDNIMLGAKNYVWILDFGLVGAAHQENAEGRGPTSFASQATRSAVTAVSKGDTAGNGLETPAMHPSGEQLTQVGAVLGTPRYMAPEQTLGEPCGVAADVFSLCVTMYEALHGKAPFSAQQQSERFSAIAEGRLVWKRSIPTWLVRALMRGMSFSQHDRHPSMEALSADLRQSMRRQTRQRAALGTMATMALLATGVSLAMPYVQSSNEVAMDCERVAQKIGEVWTSADQERLQSAFLQTYHELAPTQWQQTREAIDTWIDHWKAARMDQCLAANGKNASVSLRTSLENAELAGFCLDERAIELQTLLNGWHSIQVKQIFSAPSTVKRLTQPLLCLDSKRVRALAPAPKDPRLRFEVKRLREALAKARVDRQQSRLLQAQEQLNEIADAVAKVAFPALSAEFEGERADVYRNFNDLEQASKHYELGALAAIASGHRRFAARLKIWLVNAHIELNQNASIEDFDEGWPDLLALTVAAGAPHELMALYHRLRGIFYARRGKLDEATTFFQQSLVEARANVADGEPPWLLASALSEIALTLCDQGRPAQALPYSRESLRIWIADLGPYHFQVAYERSQIALTLTMGNRYSEAIEHSQLAVSGCHTSNIGLEICAEHESILADLYAKVGLLREADERLQKLIALHDRKKGLENIVPDPIEFRAAEVLARRGDSAGALAWVDRGRLRIANDPKALPASVQRGTALRASLLVDLQRLDEAAALLQSLEVPQEPQNEWTEFPTLVRAHTKVALAQRDYARALVGLEDGLRQRGVHLHDTMVAIEIDGLLARILLGLNEVALAQFYGERALERLLLASDNVQPHVLGPYHAILAEVYVAQDRLDEAQEHLEQAQRVFDPSETVEPAVNRAKLESFAGLNRRSGKKSRR